MLGILYAYVCMCMMQMCNFIRFYSFRLCLNFILYAFVTNNRTYYTIYGTSAR